MNKLCNIHFKSLGAGHKMPPASLKSHYSVCVCAGRFRFPHHTGASCTLKHDWLLLPGVMPQSPAGTCVHIKPRFKVNTGKKTFHLQQMNVKTAL